VSLRRTSFNQTPPFGGSATERAMPPNAARATRRQQRYMDSSFVASENHADLTQLHDKVRHLQTSLGLLQRQMGSLILLQEQQLRSTSHAQNSGVSESAD
jgi:hypothetical protein